MITAPYSSIVNWTLVSVIVVDDASVPSVSGVVAADMRENTVNAIDEAMSSCRIVAYASILL